MGKKIKGARVVKIFGYQLISVSNYYLTHLVSQKLMTDCTVLDKSLHKMQLVVKYNMQNSNNTKQTDACLIYSQRRFVGCGLPQYLLRVSQELFSIIPASASSCCHASSQF